MFFSAFSGTLLFVTVGDFGGPKVAKMKVLGGHFDAVLGVGSTCENRGFM